MTYIKGKIMTLIIFGHYFELHKNEKSLVT
jgi:hypothetical protein